MTIDEAKICLSIQVEVKHRLGKDFEARALQLGIEALKAIAWSRDQGIWAPVLHLTGETKD